MTATPNFASDPLAGADDGAPAAPAASASPFVLNLCSSTTPMALAQTDLPELRRFTFFVSRRFEEGRERFRLHMGHFATLAEAEEWLSVVREIYPGAWAGEAPGRKLRERAAAANAAQATHAAGPQPQARVSAPPRRPAPAPPAPPSLLRVPVVHAAPPVARAAAPVLRPPVAAQVARPAARQSATPPAGARAQPLQPRPHPFQPPRTPAYAAARPAPVQASPARGARPAARPATPPAAPAQPAQPKTTQRVFADSNVREVLKALGDASATGETRLMHAPPQPQPHTPPGESNSLSDTQVLRMLETRRPEGEPAGSEAPADVSHGSIPLLKPDDTGTRRALKEAVTRNAPVSFAVQLQWSVQPVDLDQVPPLAIFSAYTLYTVEGSREGRKWYGLRLGFFSDAISAKQVAYYVRSEFTSVAVVPVSPQEKSRATDQDMRAAVLAAPAVPRASISDEFKLIEDEVPAAAHSKPPGPPVKPAPKAAAGRGARQSATQARVRARSGGKVGARARSGPGTLEETLEILGASELTIEDGRGETLNDTGVRHLRVEVQKDSPFSKLLERLSERVKKA